MGWGFVVAAPGSVEYMFESDSALLDVMGAAQRDERAGAARKVIAAGRFFLQRRAALGGTHEDWCVDDWDVIAAEVAAELGVSRGRASSFMDYGQVLIERLPKLAEVFMTGGLDFRVIRIVAFRTALLTDAQAIAAIDEMLAHTDTGLEHVLREAGGPVGGLDGAIAGSRRAAGGHTARRGPPCRGER